MIERYKTLHSNLVKLKTDTYKLRQKLKYKIISDQSFQRSLSAVEEPKTVQTSNPELLSEIQVPNDVSQIQNDFMGQCTLIIFIFFTSYHLMQQLNI